MSDGYWYKPYDGEREWREAPRCTRCGGAVEIVRLKENEEATEGEAISQVACEDCGHVLAQFLRPTAAALQRGQELAERFGW